MNRVVVFSVILLLVSVPAFAGNTVDVLLGSANGDDTILVGLTNTWDVYFENDIKLGGYSSGFVIWSPDGAGWTWLAQPDGYGPMGQGDGHAAVTIVLGSRQYPPDDVWDLTGILVAEQDMDGVSPDTVLIGGTALFAGMESGTLEHQISLHFSAGAVPEGEVWTICIDSTFVPPAGNFVFVNEGGTAFPPSVLWPVGGRCYPVKAVPNFCPDWSGTNPASMAVGHCGSNAVVLGAIDPESDPVHFNLAGNTGSGAAVVVDNGDGTCQVNYTPVPADVGQAITVSVRVWDVTHGEGECDLTPGLWDLNVTVTNNAPTVDCGKTYNPVGKGSTLVKTDIVGGDVDGCDVLTYSVANVGANTPIGTYDIDAATGEFTFATDVNDAGIVYTFEVTVTDGFDESTCQFQVDVIPIEPWEIQIEKTHNTLQGHYVDVDLTVNKGAEAIGGFDFLIGYDASALAFTEASLGEYMVQCRWEYFTYRYSWNGNCGGTCPSGVLRIVGLAETNNGTSHPNFDCIASIPPGETLATLTFFVSSDLSLECMYVPIRFYWMDCGDNSISTFGGDTLAVNRYIFDFEDNQIQDYNSDFPGYVGAPDECLAGDKVPPIRFIDFINGGIDLVCSDSIDKRGDLNTNGVANEIADAVMFTNYFISGLSAFGDHINASIASSDVNADGISLSVADLVYLVRVIVGDANPYPKPLPGAVANVAMQGNMVTMDASVNVGAALLTFQVNGEIGSPVPGVSNMDMKYAREGNELRVLIFNIGSDYIEAGENVLVTIPGDVELTGAEVASYEGAGIETLIRNLPTAYAVKSFPNPFNAATTISVSLPMASDWSVKVYNVAGQLVKDFAGYSEAGQLNVTWNSTDNSGKTVASGIYFYKVQAGQFSVTKKMVLMK